MKLGFESSSVALLLALLVAALLPYDANAVTKHARFNYVPTGNVPDGDITEDGISSVFEMNLKDNPKKYGNTFAALKEGDKLKTTINFRQKALKIADIASIPNLLEHIRFNIRGELTAHEHRTVEGLGWSEQLEWDWEWIVCDFDMDYVQTIHGRGLGRFQWYGPTGTSLVDAINAVRYEPTLEDFAGGYILVCAICITITIPPLPKNKDGTINTWTPKSLETLQIGADEISLADCPDGFVKDDPHLKTWSGLLYDFMGQCDLMFLKAPNFVNGLGLDIHIRTTIRYGYSFIESAALKIGDDVLEVTSWGNYAVNGIDNADLSLCDLSGFPVVHYSTQSTTNNKNKHKKNKHVFDILVSSTQNITVSTFKDFVNVHLHVGKAQDFQDSVGLLGSFHNTHGNDNNKRHQSYPKGTMLARNGTTILTNPNEFGMEWQVRSNEGEPLLFRTIRPPQHPHQQCEFPTTITESSTSSSSRRLGKNGNIINNQRISRQQAQKACHTVNPLEMEACIFDVMQTGDVCMAAEHNM